MNLAYLMYKIDMKLLHFAHSPTTPSLVNVMILGFMVSIPTTMISDLEHTNGLKQVV